MFNSLTIKTSYQTTSVSN